MSPVVCPVLRDNEFDPFIVWYELLTNVRGSLLRVLIITSPAMGVASFEVLVSLLEEFIRDASLDFVGIYVRRGLLEAWTLLCTHDRNGPVCYSQDILCWEVLGVLVFV